MAVVAIPLEDQELHTDEFYPLSDDAEGLTGQFDDPNQSEPDLGSPVELGGQDTDDDTLTVARSGVPGVVTQNLTGQSDSPPATSGQLSAGTIAGSGTAAGTVDTGTHEGSTVVLSAMNSLGPSLAEGVLTQVAQQPTSPQSGAAGKVVLVKSSQSGLSLGAKILLVGILAFMGYFIVEGFVNAG